MHAIGFRNPGYWEDSFGTKKPEVIAPGLYDGSEMTDTNCNYLLY